MSERRTTGHGESVARVHVVRPGDCIESIAAALGCAWRNLWEHDDNRDLRERRQNPNLLAPGDILRAPNSLRPRPLSITPGGTHRYRARVPLTTVRLRLVRDHASDGGDAVIRPLANVAFCLSAGGRTVEGSTDGDGNLEARVPAAARHATLLLAPGSDDEHRVDIAVGHLDPIDEPSGVAQRLENFGLLSGPRTETTIRRALASFQAEHGLGGDGAPTPETLAKLREIHDG
ncbi:hypothetical protein BE21_21160 [Sorangium cellulosum]|uniref:Uncharacterized protein n=1 Tax=Sorangium cellulosum TaxID=56 RepID=A0A150TW26_SORCE|nr:hypothetical protein BE21_21160 [Sorangium cellulosum]